MPELSTLKSGIRVVTDTMPNAETVAVSVWIDVGSRHETKAQNGLSHFLEHMAFKGTKRRTARQIAEEFDSIGGYLNAYTSREHTVYYAKTLKGDAALSFDLLGDILTHSTFDKEELEKERGVVLQEIAMTNDTPDDIIFDHYQETAFADQALGRSILGTTERVSSFNAKNLHDFVKTHYNPDRIVVSVAGNISHKDAVKMAEDHFSEITGESEERKHEVAYTGGDFREERDLEQVHIILGFEGCSYHRADIYTAQLLANVLGGGMSSRLFQEIREERGLAYNVSAYTSNYKDIGLFSIYGSTTPDKAQEFIETMYASLRKSTDSITEEELERSRTQFRASLLMGKEGTGYRSEEMGRHYSCFGRHIPVEEIFEKLNAVKIKDLQAKLEDFLNRKQFTFAAIGPTNDLPDYNTLKKYQHAT